MKSLTPGQQIVKVVDEELTVTLGGEYRAFELGSARPAVIMMAGVQGSGKTTACAKLANQLKGKGKRPLLIAADLERPAAIEQLRTLGPGDRRPRVVRGPDPVKVAKQGLKEAERQNADVVIIDTAGRLHVDPEMMKQARRIKDVTKPHHVLMAADAMTGQDAVIQAREFMREVDTTGFILTKLDGDARGGAALSITAVTGRPVYFVGVGEKPDDLEPFYPDRMAGRILGMGDVLTLIDKAQDKLDTDEAQKAAENLMKGQFTFEDFLDQLRQMQKLGLHGRPAEDAARRAGRQEPLKEMAAAIDDGELKRAEAMILTHDPGRAARTRYHLRVPSPADRQRIRGHDRRRQLAAEGFRRREEDDADDDGRQTHPGHGEDALGEAPEAVAEQHEDEGRGTACRHGSGYGAWARTSDPSTASWWPTSGARATAASSRTSASTTRSRTPRLIEIDEERALHWLRVGAQPSTRSATSW